MRFADIVKEKLNDTINKVVLRKELYVKDPKKDFTRKRKLPLEIVIKLMLTMGGNSLNTEMLEFFNYDKNTATSSAFIQQRDKILPDALKFILIDFTSAFIDIKTYEGYRLCAFDGSDLNIAHNPEDSATYNQSVPNTKGFNLLHLNAMYDLCNKLYLDVIVQPSREENECRALTEMVDRSTADDKVIVIADRNYESYNVFAHIEKKGWNYLIRVKDLGSSGITSALNLPISGEFDKTVNIILTKKNTKEVRANRKLYKIISSTATFDYLDKENNLYYPMTFRVVRFKLPNGTYEMIITNLDQFQFPPSKIKHLYHLRWGVETSFRELKYAIGLISFHSKTVEHITLEIYARLIMYNFCELITLNVVVQQKDTKHDYQVNFTLAIHICIHFFKCTDNMPPSDPEALIKKYILPVRPDRFDPRKVKSKSTVSFIYRIA